MSDDCVWDDDEEVTAVIEVDDLTSGSSTVGSDFCPACGVDYTAMTTDERVRHQTDGEYVVCGCGGPFDDDEDTGVHIIQPSVTITMEMLPIERNVMRNVIGSALEGAVPMDVSTFNTLTSIEEKLG